MNTKAKKSVIGITLAAIMIASVFAVIAPSTIADSETPVGNPAGFGLNKEDLPLGLTYKVGDEISYTIRLENSVSSFNATVKVWDILPNNTKLEWQGNASVYFPKGGEEQWWNYTTTVMADWDTETNPWNTPGNEKFTNAVFVYGSDDNPNFPGGDTIEAFVQFSSPLLVEPAEFEFDWEPACCKNISFSGWADKEIVNYTWDFGDGETEVHEEDLPGETFHVYDECGEYIVTLKGNDTDGKDNETKEDIYVDCGSKNVIAKAEPSCYVAGGTEITFSATATPDGNNPDPLPIVHYEWTFSDDPGTVHEGQEVTRPVAEDITATVEVWVGLDDGTLCCKNNGTVEVGLCAECSLRIYGTFNEGPGDLDVKCENKPYTDPNGPFLPQNPQAPRKDFITFNPAIMSHNELIPTSDLEYGGLGFVPCENNVQTPQEKVFKRMWYEKEWFKDKDCDGEWDVVTSAGVMTLDEWKAIPLEDRPAIREYNSGDVGDSENVNNADIYGPALNQEFTYMTLDDDTMPTMVGLGSRVLIPMASYEQGNGLDSFDADADGDFDYVRVESEQSLLDRWSFEAGDDFVDEMADIDRDGVIEVLDPTPAELNSDESVVFSLTNMKMTVGSEIQFFDHIVKLDSVYSEIPGTANFYIYNNEDEVPDKVDELISLEDGEVKKFYRGKLVVPSDTERPTFYLRIITASPDKDEVTVEVGRIFGETDATICGQNLWWNQKAFMVDDVFYNVVAIRAMPECFKYITFRQKLPKTDIKLYGNHLKVWYEYMTLPEMPPFNMNHLILDDVQDTWSSDKIGDVRPYEMPPLRIDYINEAKELRYGGELKEIYHEFYGADCEECENELWTLEWFWTQPWQYTELRLPKDDKYLVTLAWEAPESEFVIWDHDPDGPVHHFPQDLDGSSMDEHYFKMRFKFWYEDCSGPLFIDKETSSIRLYGTFGEGPGDRRIVEVENKPYTDPMGPFFPQSEQAPEKDFITFNPAIMDHNQGYPELDYYECDEGDVQTPKEKVFKRMWYEKEWFKDEGCSGAWDVVTSDGVMTLDEWKAIPLEDRPALREYNSPDEMGYVEAADIYGPAINQEFTYMTLDDDTMPIMVGVGSRVLIPMASYVPGNGLDSFDADADGDRDALRVESEQSLMQRWHTQGPADIDRDGVIEVLDPTPEELNGDESVVLSLTNMKMTAGSQIQLFDHIIELDSVFSELPGTANFYIYNNEDGTPDKVDALISLQPGEVKKFYRGKLVVPSDDEKPTFYLKLITADPGEDVAIVEVGRIFGETHSGFCGGEYEWWNQKAFMVDDVFYNVVAIRATEDCFKYITFRQKLPKTHIKLYGNHLKVWDPEVILPEMPPFNMDHEICIDVQNTWTIPYSMQDKIGPKREADPLEIYYIEEYVEERFQGELKEIYTEGHGQVATEMLAFNQDHSEFWLLEWFWTQPWQYTAFVLPDDQLYLVTLAWYAPESEMIVWDGGELGEEPMMVLGPEYRRVKFWYDPADNTDLYVNRLGEQAPAPAIDEFYAAAGNGGNGDETIDIPELVNAIYDYLDEHYPFGPDGRFEKSDLIDYLQAFINQEKTTP